MGLRLEPKLLGCRVSALFTGVEGGLRRPGHRRGYWVQRRGLGRWSCERLWAEDKARMMQEPPGPT